MNKKFYLVSALALAAAFTSCDNNEEEIFDQQASDRLETTKNNYISQLTSDGGKWVIEYFANSDEPGYVMGLEFGKDGSVNISANHRWINNEYREERSLWDVITDDGPVLTFNSYNTIFHIFSDPNNVTGSFAPTNPDRDNEDVDETGYGHSGDYEFNLMRKSEAGDTIVMLGKKRGIHQYLIRLPEDTDMQAYLTETKSVGENIFSPKFVDFVMTDATGEEFIINQDYINGNPKGILSIYPRKGDQVMQTVKRNVIFTKNGIRFMSALEVPRADEDAEPLTIEKFDLQADGSLRSADGTTITATTLVEIFADFSRVWMFRADSFTGKFKTAYDNLLAGAEEYSSKPKVGEIKFSSRQFNGVARPSLAVKVGSYNNNFSYSFGETAGTEASMSFGDPDSNAKTWGKRIPALTAFGEQILNCKYILSTDNPLKPTVLTFTDASDSASSFVVDLQ